MEIRKQIIERNNYHTQFVWGRSSLSWEDIVSDASCLISKDLAGELISMINNKKAIIPSSLVSEMVKPVGQVEYNTVNDLMNQITVKVGIPAECEPSTISNCYNGKVHYVEGGN